jgi:uncharacterized damage-inducible protein DinB
MTIHQIALQFAHNEWANGLLLSAANALEPEEQRRDLASSHRSVLGTLFHLVYSEWDWVHFWQGKTWEQIIREEPAEADVPTVALLQPQWAAIVQTQKDFLGSLSDAGIGHRISYKDFQGEAREFSLGETMLHLLNHSSYHRGQVVTLIRQLGKTPPTTDFLLFLQVHRDSHGWVT